jgi:hypothetical protein
VVKVIELSSYKYRLGPGRVLPSSPVPELNIDYQIHKYILSEYHSCCSLIIWGPHPSGCPFQGRGYSNRFNKLCRGVQISPHDRRSRYHRHGLDRPNETSYPRGRYLRFPYNSTTDYSGTGTHKHQDDHTAS